MKKSTQKEMGEINRKVSNKKIKTRVLAALLACAMMLPTVSSITTYAKAAGTPLNPSDVSKPNSTASLKCAVLFPFIKGDDVVGSTLTGNYTLSINSASKTGGSAGDLSTYQWYVGNTRNGEYTAIEGATAKTFALTEDYTNKYIRFEVTPKWGDMTGTAIKSDPVGPVMTQEEFARISPRLKKDETYLKSRNNLNSEIEQRFSKATYFTISESVGGIDKTPVSNLVGSEYYYHKGARRGFSTDKPEVVDGIVMVNKDFVTNVLGAPDYDFGGQDKLALTDVAAALNKFVFFGTDEVKAGANGNYRSTAQAEGLVIITDTDLELDVVADRDVLNELTNQVYNLRASEEELEWFRDAKFGMFIHWDPGTSTGSEIGWGRGPGPQKVTSKKPAYDLSYQDFNPADFDADAIVQSAIDMGCKYLIFTSKHHGGFQMWDTNFFPEHSILGTPYGKDPLREEVDIIQQLSDAAHEKGLKFGLYYSPQDWYNDYCYSDEHYRWMETYMGHLTELFSKYGTIDIFWPDAIGSALPQYNNLAPTGWNEAWGAWDPRTVLRRVKQLQPGILVNDRYVYRWEDPKPWDKGGLPEDIQGDYITPEQTIAGFNNQHAWESCLTIDGGNAWSYNRDTGAKNPTQVTGNVISNACNDGNVLLNMGLMYNGEFSEKHMTAFQTVGKWVVDNGEAIYNTRGGPYVEQKWGGSTYKKNDDGTNTVYLHISPKVRGAVAQTGNVLNIANSPDGKEYHAASLLGQPDVTVELEKTATGYTITLPQGMTFANGNTMETLDTIIKLEESLDAAIANAANTSKEILDEMKAEGYPEILKSYETALTESYNALKAAETKEQKAQALKDSKAFMAAFNIAKTINDTVILNEKAVAEAIVGNNSWELPQEMKSAIEGRIATAKAAMQGATIDVAQLTNILDGLKSDAQYLNSLQTMTVISITPDSSYIQPETNITLHTENKDLEIRYTVDRTEPTATSKLYTEALKAPKQGAFEVKAANFSQGKKVGVTYSRIFVVNTSESANLLLNKAITCSDETMTPATLAKINDGNRTNEAKFPAINSASITFDLGTAKTFNTIMLYENYYIGFNEVRNVEVQYSTDGQEFTTADSKVIQASGNISFDAVTAQYIRINLPSCQGPIIQEIEAYNVQKPDMSAITLKTSNAKFTPGYPIKLSVTGEIDEQPINAKDVTYVIEPKEAGVLNGNILSVSKDFAGAKIDITAKVVKQDKTIVSNKVTLTTGSKLNVVSSDADSAYSGDYSAAKAFDGSMSTRWATSTRASHWIKANFIETGYNKVIVREYLDGGVWAQPNHSRVRNFTLQYRDPLTNKDIVVFDTANPGTDGTYKRTSPQKITNPSGWDWVDENGDVAATVHEVMLNKTIPANNLKLVTSNDSLDVTFFEVETYGPSAAEPVDTNKTILNFVIDKATELKETPEYANVIGSVQKSFSEALESAVFTNENPASTQEQVNAAWVTLMTEIHKLGFQQGDKTALQEAYNLYKLLDLELYIDGAQKDNFVVALAAALDVINSNEVMQAEVKSAHDTLVAAAQALVKRGDKTSLSYTLSIANAYDENDYVTEGWAEFIDARTQAQAVQDNANVTQEQVDTANSTLVQTMLKLRYKATKETLDKVLAAASEINTALYTPATAAAFEEAVNKGRNTLADPNATDKDIADAVEAIKARQAELQLLEIAPPVDGGVNTDNTTSAADKEITTAGNKGTTNSATTGETNAIPVIAVVMLLACTVVVLNRKKKNQ